MRMSKGLIIIEQMLICGRLRLEVLTVLKKVLGCSRELSFLRRPGVQRDLPARGAGNDWLKSLPQHTIGAGEHT